MAKKRYIHHDGAHGGTWKIALADLMTVLMIFFLVMWVSTVIDPAQKKQLISGFYGKGATLAPEKEDLALNEDRSSLVNVLDYPSYSNSQFDFALKNLKVEHVTVDDAEEFIRITLSSDNFFKSGRAFITDKSREAIEQIGELLASKDVPIVVTGYTDNIPINNLQFPSNWELSSARAATVARTLIYMGVKGDNVTVVGKGQHDAEASNDTDYGRSLNRRVVIEVQKDKQR